MISELLTNSSWIQPQFDFLIYLQNLRFQTGGIFDQFFISMTKFGGELHFPTLFIALIYWCISSESGLFLFLVNGFTLTFSQLFKMAACVYRPWILNSAIKPSALVMKSAGSYSFPSGHSMMAASTWGAMAYVFRNKKLLCAFLIFFTLLIGFTRLYLGVHTPQDVIIGLLTGVIFIFTVFPLINWCNKNKKRYIYLLAAINIFLTVVLLYILNKTYPMDYINGKLLVDPRRGINISVVYFGWLFGLLNGAILCKRFFPFDAKAGSKKSRIIRGIVGFITAYIISETFQYLIFKERIITDYKLMMPVAFIVTFYITAIYPWMFQKIKFLRKYLYD
ncbi:phosphatase PAP2 family protein [bacterium]|nr:phosphatase PAP2 family protein [bacterium]